MVNAYLVVSAIVAILAIALGAAYTTGALDPVIEQIGILFFKAKAKAEEKKMEAEGEKEGEDFLSSQLKGNKQADDIKKGLGSIGGLKKGF